MSKPLLVFKFNDRLKFKHNDNSISQTMEQFTDFLEGKFRDSDYILLVLPERMLGQNFDIQVFRTETAQEVDIEKLKKEVQEVFKIKEPQH